ncbi:MAG TPA: type IV secretion system protein [Methylobacter sp.]|jgi:type IV secretion system protein VirB6
MSTFVTTFNNTVSGFLGTYVSGVSSQLCLFALPLVAGGWTLHTIVFGYAILRGDVQQPIMQYLWKALKVLIIIGAGLGIGISQMAVLNIFWSAQTWLVGVMSGMPGLSFVQILEAYLTSVATQCLNMTNTAAQGAAGGGGWLAILTTGSLVSLIMGLVTGLIFALISITITAFAFILAAAAMLVFLAAQVSLAAVLAVSPLFIAGLAFDKTARFFDGWLSQALNYIFVAGLTGMVLGLSNQVLAVAITNITTMVNTLIAPGGPSVLSLLGDIGIQLVSFGVVNLMCVYFFFQCPAVASGLVGGSGLGGPGNAIKTIRAGSNLAASGYRGARSLMNRGNRMGGK